MSGTYEAQAQKLFQMRRRLEEISEEMSMAITIEFDLARRMDQAAADLRAAKKKLEEQ
jgi:hypothetical protein